MNTILPSHRPQIEKAIDIVAGERFEALPVWDINTNPKTCPESILKVLAVSFNIDISGLSEAQARRLVANGFNLSRYRGTVYAVKQAIETFCPEGELLEYPDRPYIFGVKIPAGYVVEREEQALLFKLLDAAKNARSHYEIDVKTTDIDLNIYKTEAITVTLKGEAKTDLSFKGFMAVKSGVALRI